MPAKGINVKRKLISGENEYWTDLDQRWKAEGFDSRSSYIRHCTDLQKEIVKAPEPQPEQQPIQEISFI